MFFEFIRIYFELKIIKFFDKNHALMWQLTWAANDVLSRGDVYTYHVTCACESMCVRVSVMSGLKILFKIYANQIYTLYLYTRRFALTFAM